MFLKKLWCCFSGDYNNPVDKTKLSCKITKLSCKDSIATVYDLDGKARYAKNKIIIKCQNAILLCHKCLS